MKIPLVVQERLNCRSSELLFRQCLGDLYLQFLAMDQKSKGGHGGDDSARQASIWWHCDSSDTSGSSTEFVLGNEVMFFPPELQSSFSGKSSPAARSAESLVLSEGDFGADLFRDALPKEGLNKVGKRGASSLTCLSDEFGSAEVNPVTYENFTLSSRAPRAGFMTESSSTSLSTTMGQYNDQSLTSPPKAHAGRGASVPADSEGVSDAESVSFVVRQSDSKWGGATGMNFMGGHRFSHPLVKLMCSFGGRIVPRPYDRKLRYVGGVTRIISVDRNICYAELMYKLTESYGVALTLKYQLPDEDLDALVSVSSDDDLQNMMEEHDRVEAGGGSSRLRLFLFSAAEYEYDIHDIQNRDDDDDFKNSDQPYVDAINGLWESSSVSRPFESGLIGAVQQVEERFGSDIMSITRRGYAAEGIRTNTQECISGIVHQPTVWPVSSIKTFPRSPSAPSSAASSPPMPSRQTYVRQQPAAADISLQLFQDRLNKVSVQRHCPMSSEACFQNLDQVGARGFSSRQREHHFSFLDFQRGACSPRPLVSEIELSKGEQFRTGDAATGLMESQSKSANVFEQHVEHGTTSGNGPTDLRSDSQQLHEVLVPPSDLQRLVQQQQQCHHQHQHRLMSQQQQSAWQSPGDSHGHLERDETAVHHFINDAPSQSQALQQPSLYAPYIHSHHITAGHNVVSRQVEQQPVHQEDPLRGTFMQRSASSHAIGMGAQPSYGLPSASDYHLAAAPSAPTIVLHDFQAQHHLQANRAFSTSRNDQPQGRRVHYGDQASRNFRLSVSPPRFRGNTAYSDEWTVRHQQQPPTLLADSEAGFQELVGNSSEHLYERFPVSQYQFSGSQTNAHSPQYADIFVPGLEQMKTRCETACLETDAEASIQKPSLHQLNSGLDYHHQRRQAAEQVPLYPAYRERHDKAGEWIGSRRRHDTDDTEMLCSGGAPSRQHPSGNEDLGRVLEGGKCVETGYNLYCNCARDGFDSPTLLAVGGIGTISYPRTEWPESSGAVPAALYPSNRAMHAANVSRGVIREELQVAASPMSLRSTEPDQLPSIATPGSSAVHNSERTFVAEPGVRPYLPGVTSQALPGFYMLAEQKSLGLTSPRLVTPVVDAKTVSSDFGGARDTVNLLNGGHVLKEPSACDEMYLGNIHCRENHVATSTTPEGGVGWITADDNNALGEKAPNFQSVSLLPLDCVQPECENAFLEGSLPCTLGREKSPDASGGSNFPISVTAAVVAAASCLSTQVVQSPYPWHAFHPTSLSAGEQDEASSTLDLPIYDRSPVGSVNTTASKDFFLDPDEIGISHAPLDSEKGNSVGRMSLTGRLAEDMICSVLESCGKAASYETKTLSEEVVEENSDDHERKGRREEDLNSTIKQTEKNVFLPPTVQDRQGSVMLAGHFSRENMNIEEASDTVAEERGASEEMKHETSEHEGDGDSDGVGKKGMNCCVAEVEAISRGLQTIKNADLEEIRELGSGTFGTVYHGKWRGSDVAIKRIKASCFTGPPSEQDRLLSDFWREACTLGQLHHPNVVAFYGVVPDGPDGTMATVTEYMVNGSLKQVLHKKDRTIDRRKRLLIAMDAAFGMEYLHSKNIVHFDLKCENLLVNMRDPHRPICKVGDFGLSKVKHHTLVSGGVRGTLPWMAPELLSGNNSMVNEKIDVFSFGIVMWELLTGEEPYASMHCGAIIGGIVNNTLRPSVPSWCDPVWRSLMERCWSGDPANRPTFSEVACELRAIAASMNLK